MKECVVHVCSNGAKPRTPPQWCGIVRSVSSCDEDRESELFTARSVRGPVVGFFRAGTPADHRGIIGTQEVCRYITAFTRWTADQLGVMPRPPKSTTVFLG